MPAYLKKGWGESRWRRVVRFRLGNEMKDARYLKQRKGSYVLSARGE